MCKKILSLALILSIALAVCGAQAQTQIGETLAENALAKPVITGISATDGVITLNWNAVSGAVGYLVYRSGEKNGSYSYIGRTAMRCFADSPNLKAGVRRYYKVQATGAAGMSAMSETVSAVVSLTKPVATLTLKSATSAVIRWNAVKGATGYSVYRAVNGAAVRYLTSTQATSLTAAITASDSYDFYVMAYADRGVTCSVKSAVVSVSRSLGTPVLSTVAAQADGTIRLIWSAVNGATSYRVYRKTDGGSYEALTALSTIYYTDSAVSAGKTYTYRVRAEQGTLFSAYSAALSATLTLDAPVIQSASVSSNLSVTLTWNVVKSKGGYHIYRKTDNGSWRYVASTRSTRYTDANLTSGQTYSYRVMAYWGSLRSGYSTAVTRTLSLNAPQHVTVTAQSGSSVKVTWPSVSGVSGYNVYRKTNNGAWRSIGATRGTSWLDTGLTDGVAYTYQVMAYKGSLRSEKTVSDVITLP